MSRLPSRYSPGPHSRVTYGPCRICSEGIELADWKTSSGRPVHKACAERQAARSAGQPHRARKGGEP